MKKLIIIIMLSATVVYGQQVQAYNSDKFKGFVHEGGARSSKTTSIIQFLLTWAERQETQKRVIIARSKNTWTRATTLYDFINVMKGHEVYDIRNHNRTEGIIKYHKVEFWFGGLDDPQRLHGFTSDAIWINEANEISKNDFDQLEMRCSGFFILDYNPNIDNEHWIPATVIKRNDVKYIHSTVLDNPFAPEAVVRKIKSYEPNEINRAAGTADKQKWEIYGLGIRAVLEGLVFNNWDIVDEIPSWCTDRVFGLDFGYTYDPTGIVEIGISKRTNELFIDEHCYQTGMLNSDIARRLKQLKVKKVVADSAEPKSIQEIYNHGINIIGVKKGAGSVINGIDIMKRFKIHLTARSVNLIKEFKNYKHMQDKNGKYLNDPIDDFNHEIDAARYVCMNECSYKSESHQDLTKIFY
jgi:phage terminase large subunit